MENGEIERTGWTREERGDGRQIKSEPIICTNNYTQNEYDFTREYTFANVNFHIIREITSEAVDLTQLLPRC